MPPLPWRSSSSCPLPLCQWARPAPGQPGPWLGVYCPVSLLLGLGLVTIPKLPLSIKGNNETVIISNNDVITEVIIGNNRSNNK